MHGEPLVPCGRCRQLLYEHGGPELLFERVDRSASCSPTPSAPTHLAAATWPMNAIDVIRTKRDGGRLSDEQIDWFIRPYTDGAVADEQASALLMAILFRGLDPDELARWTQR